MVKNSILNAKGGAININWPIVDLNRIFEWIKNTKINNVNIEADKVYVTRNIDNDVAMGQDQIVQVG